MDFHFTRVLCVSALVLALFSGCSQLSSDSPPAPTPDRSSVEQYSAEQFFETRNYRGNDINHRNDALLVASDESGVYNLYKVSLDGETWTPLTDSKSDPQFPISWFPEDDRVLFTADQGGNELNHIYVRETDGTVVDLTPGEDLKAMFLKWTTDNNLWLVSNERDNRYFDIYRYNSEDYQRELMFENNLGYTPQALSDDGRWLALVKSRNNADNDVYLVDLQQQSAQPELITAHDGDISHSVYGFSRDNQTLVFGSNEGSEFVRAFTHELSSGKQQLYSEADWDISFIGFSKDNRYRVEAVNADASTQISIIDQKTEQPLQLPQLPAGDLRGIRFSDDSSILSFYLNADNSPSNLYVWHIGDVQVKRLTEALNPAIDEQDLVVSEVVRFQSFDGLEIPALQYKPHQASAQNKVPALILIHGGPGGQSRTGYSPLIQHLVNHGYAILAVNNRGSSGYGKTFYHLDDLRHGEDDLQDIVFGKNYLQGMEWIDEKRIGVMGGSYGGYLTMAAMAFTDEFEAGINIFGVTNWVRTLTSIPPWWEAFREALYAELGDPEKDAERLHRISPLFHADKVQNPVLVVQGANDPRVLQVESDEMVEAIRAQGVPVEYVLFDDEGHGFLKRENRITAQKAYLKFLQQHL
ncbi:S9 family peptidase [Lacimicrobium alkaliphilum]|uniref:Peptidase S9 n=1 Tax=Lacimicrobium alkaliphilum TaxID=1526571 RepID=A0ABQ1RDI1_9ALTE|nr:S9 family peptidase [Lacimicrobium alkaliphilum]GGD66121.1 peptidase S9 [Lacimicrobium alkaliphilum]